MVSSWKRWKPGVLERKRWGGKRWSQCYLWKARPDCKVWITGLTETNDPKMNKALQEHLKQGGLNCKYAKIKKGGIGGAVYTNENEAAKAVLTLTGSMFEGLIIQLDLWERNADRS
eukprot:12406583-Karenia_brevis.AAC.1